MSKNIEIQINTGSDTYEALYPKTLGSLISGMVSSATTATNANYLTGTIGASQVTAGTFGSTNDSNGYIFPSNVRLKNSSNYGMKLNFGDGDYVYLYEDSDDNLTIKAKRIELTTTNGLINNGSTIGGGSGYTIEFKYWVGTGNSSGNTTLTFTKNIEYVLLMCGLWWNDTRTSIYLPQVLKTGQTVLIPDIDWNNSSNSASIGYVTVPSMSVSGTTLVVDNDNYNSIATLTYCAIGFLSN